jgi:trk system potassium uptake protein TrkH
MDLIAVVFMFAAGVNFSLHFVAFRHRSLIGYFQDSEFKFYAAVMGVVVIIVITGLYYDGVYDDPWDAVVQGLFQAVSISTTAGFTTAEFYNWPGFLAILLLFGSFVGGCAGSTGGGIKVIRLLLLVKQGVREISRLVHPSAQIPVRVGDKTISPRVVEAVWGFFALYVASFTVMYLTLAMTGIELMTAFSAVAACINNLGPGLAGVGANYAELHNPAKWILCFAMLLGRLEIFTLLVLLSPAFWRR